MKSTYPKYRRHGLEAIWASFPHSEQAIIDDFIRYCAITAGKGKQADIRRNIIQFKDVVERGLDEITLLDVRNFLALLNQSDREEYTRNGIKVHVRRFLKWRFKNWSERFEEFRDVRLRDAFNHLKINEGTLLRKEQVEAIVQKENDHVRRTFFITLFESGVRPKEIRTLLWKDVRLDCGQGLSELHIFATKTRKARTVFVKEATPYLKRLLENRQSEYVFPSVHDFNEPLSKSTALGWIREMGKAAGLKIFPYLLRHSRGHELYSKLPSKVAQKFMGHGSDMSELYAHISSSDIRDSVLKTVYNFDEMPAAQKHRLESEIERLWKTLAVIGKHFPEVGSLLANDLSVTEIKEAIGSDSRFIER